jgi:nitrous oxidase accessory protein
LDVDADNVSELPYRTVDLLGGRREKFAYVDLLAASPGLALLEEALRRVPALDVPSITDERPLLRPPAALDVEAGVEGMGLLTFCLTILAAGLALLWNSRS